MSPTAEKTHDTVEEIPERVDVVDVFLSSEKTSDIAEEMGRGQGLGSSQNRTMGLFEPLRREAHSTGARPEPN